VRLVLDVNTLVSGLLWRGAPRDLLNLARDSRYKLISSTALVASLDEVLHRQKFVARIHAAGLSAHDLVTDIARLAEIVTPTELPAAICRDPDDDVVLATAIAGVADAVVSGDRDLTVLRQVNGIPILAVHDALVRLSAE
jgi:putative PIN family toxin of toxin-antitoxin system